MTVGAKSVAGESVAGVLLAGGLSRRMGGGDKCLRDLGGKPILAHIVERARPQVGALVLNANGDAARFDAFGLPVAADVVEGYAGPLAGILTGLDWAAQSAPDAVWLASFASDAPFFPEDMVARMAEAVEAEGADLACAITHGRTHPVFGLWRVSLRDDLRRAMIEEEIRKVDRWTARHKLVEVDFPDVQTPAGALDPFFNTNRPEDLEEAAGYLV